MNTETKKGRGRPKGATSTVEITLSDLLSKIGNNPDAKIKVGRVWLNQFGLTFVQSSSQDGDIIPENVQAESIEFSITR